MMIADETLQSQKHKYDDIQHPAKRARILIRDTVQQYKERIDEIQFDELEYKYISIEFREGTVATATFNNKEKEPTITYRLISDSG